MSKSNVYEVLADRIHAWWATTEEKRHLRGLPRLQSDTVRSSLINTVGDLAKTVVAWEQESAHGNPLPEVSKEYYDTLHELCGYLTIYAVKLGEYISEEVLPVGALALGAIDWRGGDMHHVAAELSYYAAGPDPSRIVAFAWMICLNICDSELLHAVESILDNVAQSEESDA